MLAIFAGLSALPPTLVIFWTADELFVQWYIHNRQILFRSDLENDYGFAVATLLQLAIAGPLLYLTFFVLFLRFFLRLEARRDREVLRQAQDGASNMDSR